MPTSRCGQFRKGSQVFAFRVIPGIERGGSLLVIDLPVHLTMPATVTGTPDCDKLLLLPGDKLILLVGDGTGCISTIFKAELGCPACN